LDNPTVTTQNPKKVKYWLQLFSALLGIGLSLYLLVQHTRLKSGIQGSASFCSLGGFADCDVVNASQNSELVGIPIAAFGAIFYFTLLMLGLISDPKDKNFRFCQRLSAWLAIAGLGVDAGLFVLQFISIKSLCIMCFATYLATLMHLGCNLLMTDGSGLKNRFASAVKPHVSGKLSAATVVVSLIATASFAAVVGLIPYYIRTNSSNYQMVNDALTQFYATWKDKPARLIDVNDNDPKRGNPNAKVRIVEFSDFECAHCRRAAFTLHTALKPMEDHVQFVFKNFPLDSSCNPSMNYQLHANACNLARLGICAWKKGKFWEYHDQVFLRLRDEDFHQSWDNITELLKPVMSKEEISACIQDASALVPVTDAIKQGSGLGIQGTPTIYIDGKQVTIPVTIDTLRKLISLEEAP